MTGVNLDPHRKTGGPLVPPRRQQRSGNGGREDVLPLQIRGELLRLVGLALRICDAKEPPRDLKESPGDLRAHALSGAIEAATFQLHQLLHRQTFDEAEDLATMADRVVEAWREGKLHDALFAGLETGVKEYKAARDGA